MAASEATSCHQLESKAVEMSVMTGARPGLEEGTGRQMEGRSRWVNKKKGTDRKELNRRKHGPSPKKVRRRGTGAGL